MEQTLFTQFLLQFGKSSPLFLLIFLGFALSRWFGFNKTASTVLSKFAFNIALPAMLFRLLSNLALTESHADLRLLIAFFGACFILFFIGRFVSGYLLKMKPENSIRNKKVELAVSSVVFLYAANIVWYFLTGVFEWGDPLGVYLIFIANGILGLILYVAVSLICYRKIKISPKNNRVLRICLIIITGIFFVWLVLFRLLPNFE